MTASSWVPPNDSRMGRWAKRGIAASIFVIVLGMLIFRITNSLELGDEVYNGSFVDDWLKGGIATSTFLVLHQTAALISYPFVLAFYYVTGSTDSLLLFLRFLFIGGNLLAGVSLYFCLRKMSGTAVAFLAMIAMLSFLPSGAPTAAYSSWGSQFLAVALATLGLALNARSSNRATMWFVMSALAWSLMVVAYPTLVAATLAGLVIFGYSTVRPADAWRYAGIVLVFLAATVAFEIWVFTWDRLRASFEFLAAFNGSENFTKKIKFTTDVFANNPYFCLQLIIAIGIGLMRRHIGDRLAASFAAILLASQLFMPVFPAAMLARSADAVMLATATGVGMLLDLRRGIEIDERRRIFAVLYATSLCAAMVTTVTATVSIWCFMIGALPGSIIAIASFAITAEARRYAVAAMTALAAVFLTTSLTLYSGEWPPVYERTRITWGQAKGLSVPEWEASLINMMRDEINPMLKEGDTILVEGRYSGLGVLSPARTKALSIYNLHVGYTTERALKQVADFYSDPANRPTIVVIYKDSLVHFHDPFGDKMTDWYDQISSKSVAAGTITVHRRKDP